MKMIIFLKLVTLYIVKNVVKYFVLCSNVNVLNNRLRAFSKKKHTNRLQSLS